jgi:hypothetical protein
MAAPESAALGKPAKLDVRDALESLYTGGALATVSERHNVDRRRLVELFKRLQPGLVNDAQRRSLRRVANAVARVEEARA